MEPEEIEATNAEFVSALERRDAAAMASCYTEDAVLLPPGTPAVTGRDAVQAFWWAGIEGGLQAVKLETLTLDVYDGAALEVGRATVTLEPPAGPTITDVGKYVVLHRRQPGGSWKWAVDIFNSDADPGAIER